MIAMHIVRSSIVHIQLLVSNNHIAQAAVVRGVTFVYFERLKRGCRLGANFYIFIESEEFSGV